VPRKRPIEKDLWGWTPSGLLEVQDRLRSVERALLLLFLLGCVISTGQCTLGLHYSRHLTEDHGYTIPKVSPDNSVPRPLVWEDIRDSSGCVCSL
jgi:hypothetical protein